MLKTIAIATAATLLSSWVPMAQAEEPGLNSTLAQAPASELTFVELMWLNEDGGGMEAAQDYFQKLSPILQRHDVNFNTSYLPVAVANGYLQAPDFIFSFTFGSQKGMQAFGPDPKLQDPDYAKLIPIRNRIFNFDDRLSFQVQPF